MSVFFLSEKIVFPPPELAGKDGLLAVGGDLSEERLILAYQMGIFPWFSDDSPILWWSPEPRLVLFPRELHISKRLKRISEKDLFEVSFDKAFKEVIVTCATIHKKKHKGIAAFIVPTDTEGVKLGKHIPKLGQRSSNTCSVVLRDVRVKKEGR